MDINFICLIDPARLMRQWYHEIMKRCAISVAAPRRQQGPDAVRSQYPESTGPLYRRYGCNRISEATIAPRSIKLLSFYSDVWASPRGLNTTRIASFGVRFAPFVPFIPTACIALAVGDAWSFTRNSW
jgi:hypothetical protein